jgi:hypothetical protein
VVAGCASHGVAGRGWLRGGGRGARELRAARPGGFELRGGGGSSGGVPDGVPQRVPARCAPRRRRRAGPWRRQRDRDRHDPAREGGGWDGRRDRRIRGEVRAVSRSWRGRGRRLQDWRLRRGLPRGHGGPRRRRRPGFHRCSVPREQPRVLDGRRAAPTHRPDGWSSRRHPPRLAARQAAPDHRIHPPGATREREGRHRVGVLGAQRRRTGS